MITPDFLNEVVKNTEDVVAEVNESILRKLTHRIAESFSNEEGNLLIPASQADIKLLIRSGMVYSDIEEELKKRLPAIEKEIHRAFLISADEMAKQNNNFTKSIVKEYGIDVKVPDYEKVGIPKKASDLMMTPAEIRTLEDMFSRTNRTVKNMVNSSATLMSNEFYRICDEAFARTQRGDSLDSVLVDSIKEMSDLGIETVEYASGRVDKMEVAVARAVRTGINQANSNITLTRCAEMGINTVKVSEHLGARVTKKEDYTNHAHWQGKVYSLDWKSGILSKYAVSENEENENTKKGFGFLQKIKNFFTGIGKKKYPDFIKETGYGNILGLAGVNCRHTFYPFDAKVNIDRGQQISEEDSAERYKEEQTQRAYEREIRKLKRELAGFEGSGLDVELILVEKNKIKMRLYEMSDVYMDYCKKHNLTPRNWSLKI